MNVNLYSNKLLLEKHKEVIRKNIEEIKRKNENIPDDYIIEGTCEEESDFFIYINNIIDENGEITDIGNRYIAKVQEGKFRCELEILPTTLNYMFIQNPENFQNPIIPKITSVQLCNTKYVEDMKYAYFGTDL